MRILKPVLAAVAIVFAMPALASEDSPKVEIGKLSCLVEGEHSFHCWLYSNTRMQLFTGRRRSGGKLQGDRSRLWAGYRQDQSGHAGLGRALHPSANRKPGLLAGTYGGLTAGASVGAGIKANALLGGFDRSIALNPFQPGKPDRHEPDTGCQQDDAGTDQLSLSGCRCPVSPL